ncbi:MAG: DUF456 domain-containing protein [Kiritimatiellae bacterium]|nr:DUF456 domain-containing protein [Kiritimatiellia bacterium]
MTTALGPHLFTLAISFSFANAAIVSVVFLCCLIGVIMCLLSLSGTWVVVLAAAIALAGNGPFPTWQVIFAYVAIAIALEVFEFFAGAWGVQRRGGSRLAGVAAVTGSFAGLCLGTIVIPVPVVGSMLGMLLGGFAFVFLVEWRRLKKGHSAIHIAWGSVLARIAVIFLKVFASVGLSAYLLCGMLRG